MRRTPGTKYFNFNLFDNNLNMTRKYTYRMSADDFLDNEKKRSFIEYISAYISISLDLHNPELKLSQT